MKYLKTYKLFEYSSESIDINTSVDVDYVTITASINGNYIGEIIIEYVISGYWEFEDELTEEEYYKLFPNDTFAKISSIEVSDVYKGKGYGKILMNKAIENIKNNNEKTIYLNASPMGLTGLNIYDLVEFYKNFGFKVVIGKYHDNKEMLLTLESVYRPQGSTERTIDAYIKIYGDEVKVKQDAAEYERKKKRLYKRADISIGKFDDETPEDNEREVEEPLMTKVVSLAYGSTNMP